MAPDDSALTVVVTDALGRRSRRGGAAASAGLAAWLRRAAPARARGDVTIALVSDARIRRLNRTYRGKDYATDVLSFPSARSEVAKGSHPNVARGSRLNAARGSQQNVAQGFSPAIAALEGATNRLGDIVIATGVARRQARDLGHSLAVELRVLSLHGLLHLLGYDHERDRGRMRTLEQRLLRRSGFGEGLIERAGHGRFRRQPRNERRTTGRAARSAVSAWRVGAPAATRRKRR